MNYSHQALGVASAWGYEGQSKQLTIHKNLSSHPAHGSETKYIPAAKCGVRTRILPPDWNKTLLGMPYRKCINCFGKSGVIRLLAEGFHDEQ